MPIQTLKVGALGTHKCLGLARAKGATILFAYISEVYWDPLEHPQRETYWGINPNLVLGAVGVGLLTLGAMAIGGWFSVLAP